MRISQGLKPKAIGGEMSELEVRPPKEKPIKSVGIQASAIGKCSLAKGTSKLQIGLPRVRRRPAEERQLFEDTDALPRR
jgi:hypothetical protein